VVFHLILDNRVRCIKGGADIDFNVCATPAVKGS